MVGKLNKESEESAVDAQMKAFGEYLEELRREKRMSLGELSDELRRHGAPKHGTSRQHLGALERGEVSNPSPKLLEDLAKALGAMSAEYWLMAGHIPPGAEDSKEAYTLLLQEVHKKGFKRMLKDEGLTAANIAEVLSKVSDETIDRVVRREEPLLVSRESFNPGDVAAHKAEGFEVHSIESMSFGATEGQAGESAAEYMLSVEDEFDVKGSPPKRSPRTKDPEQELLRLREEIRQREEERQQLLKEIRQKEEERQEERQRLEAVAQIIHSLLNK